MGQCKVRKPAGSLLRFVTRAVSDRSKGIFHSHRLYPAHSRTLAIAAMRATKRGRAKGLR